MAHLVELPVNGTDGQSELVKVQVEADGDGLVRVARPGQVVARATRSLGEMVAAVRPVAQNFVDGFRGMASRPDEITVEFGLTLSAEADVVISSTAAQANFNVTLVWHKPPADSSAAATTTRDEPTRTTAEPTRTTTSEPAS
ncbi:CU044_2847 family protein [Streptomyces ipomoeae]|uniref:CU044_2847 family protein n=1 Tax=Streptomyces ipomoeae TaxID=103232 RepID=UPI001C66436A|nr:CU044_2847 family protein [Streptomyces ipomoeae]MDX2939088.1 CU044_2847 family protein [Streptomyces ipomoeae]